MFSGIVEAQARIVSVVSEPGLVRIQVERPSSFDDLKPGDSVAVDGICLTVESPGDGPIQFALAAETLAVTGWTEASLMGRAVNLERSLRVGDRVHGHFVTGHVDAMGEVTSASDDGRSRLLDVLAPASAAPYVWRKGSWALNGVSLTVNDVVPAAGGGVIVKHCLIPETLARTNLRDLQAGSRATIEVDSTARAFLRALELGWRPDKDMR